MTIVIDKTPEFPKLLDLRQVMNLTRLSRPTVYRYIQRGEIKPVKIGGRVTFLESQIRSWINTKIEAGKVT